MIRNFRMKDLFSFVNMMWAEWGWWWNKRSNTRIACWLYALAIVGCSEWIVVYERNGKVLGLAGLECYKRAISGRLSFRFRAWLCRFIVEICKYLPIMKDKATRLDWYASRDDVIPDSMRENGVASGSMFIVDKSVRKISTIGGRLAKALIEQAYCMQIHTILAETYDSCDVSFYRKHMELVKCWHSEGDYMPDGSPEKTYIFRYSVPDLKLVDFRSRFL